MTDMVSINYLRRYTSIGFAVALGGALVICLAGCGATPAPQPSVAAVSASEAALAAAGRVVMGCYAVPACAAVAPKAKIRAAYDTAYTAVTQAQKVADAGGSPDMTAATAAMSELQGLVAQLPPAQS